MTLSRIPIAVVGLNFGKHMLDQLSRAPASNYFSLAGVCSQQPEATREYAAKYACTAYHDLDQLLANPDIPTIGLFTGPVGRSKLIRKIIRAGKDVMTTKPFELDPNEAMDVLEEASKLGRVVHMNSPSPVAAPDLRQIFEWRDRLDLGRSVACRADVWASYRESADGNWYDDPALCPVAPIFRLGIYAINDLVQVFGPPESVQVTCSRLFTGRPTPDNAQMTILFKNGSIATFFASFCVNDLEPYKNSLVLNFERGTIYRNAGPGHDEEPQGVRMSAVFVRNHKRFTERAEHSVSSGSYLWDIFAKAVRGETLEHRITSAQVVDGIRVIQAMAKSEKSGASVHVA